MCSLGVDLLVLGLCGVAPPRRTWAIQAAVIWAPVLMLGRGLRPPEDGVVRHRRPECPWPLVLHVVCHLSGRVGLNSILGLYGRRSGEKKE